MLVLSRKSGEAIVFPSLDITVTVSRIRGRNVTLAVEAGDHVRILRKELVPTLTQKCSDQLGSKVSHAVRNNLNSIGLSLNVLLSQVEAGREADSQILSRAIADLQRLDDSLTRVTDESSSLDKDDQRLALLVEDNDNESALLSAFMRDYGFRVIHAKDGNAALSFLDYAPFLPDVVLLDMNMPGMSGQETVRVIRERPSLSKLRLFAVSGMAPEEAQISIDEQGVNRWFQKPIRPDELISQIKQDLAA